MTQVPTSPFSVAAARRATRQRWLIRIMAGLILTLALAYATLPLWLPTERLRKQLESQLSDELGTPVRIANIRAGWLQGVVLEDLTIANPGAAKTDNTNPGPLARIGRIRCDLSPFTVAVGATLRELEIVDPQIWLEIDEAGQLKLPPFKGKQGGRLPSFNYAVRGLVCHVIAPAVAQSFRIDRLNVQLDPPSGLLHLTSVTRVERPNPDANEPMIGRLNFDANIHIPRLKKSEPLNGSIEVEWSDLALTDLPVPLISRVPVEQVDGTTSGRLTFQTRPDLSIDYSVAIAFDRVRIMRPDLNRPAQVPDAEFACNGHWDPTEGHVVLKDLAYETPAIKLESLGGDLPALRIDEDSDKAVEAHVRGTIKNWRKLRNELPDLDHLLQGAGVEVDGQSVFVADASRGLREDRLALTVSGRESRWTVGNGEGQLLDAGVGLAKDLKIETLHERTTRRVRQPVFSLKLGDAEIEANGEAVLPPDESDASEDLGDSLGETISGFRGHLAVRCADAASLRKLLPVLAKHREIDQWSGPFEVAIDLDPEDEWSRLKLSADLGPEAILRAGELIHKREGRPLQLRAAAKIPYSSDGRVDLLNANLRYGAGELDLSSHNGSFDYRLDFRETMDGPVLAGADGSWRTDMRVRSVEDLVNLVPCAARALKQGGITFLAGQLDLNTRTDFSYRPGDSIVRTHARILADDLAVRWNDSITKRAGEPVGIDVAHSVRDCADGLDQHWAAVLVQPSGTIRASALLSQDRSFSPPQCTQLIEATADFDELADGINLFTAAADQLKLHASGGLSASVRVLQIDQSQAGRAQVNADDCELADTRGFAFHKAAGTPLGAHVSWQVAPDAQDKSKQLWTITNCGARLGGQLVDRVDASFVLDKDDTNPLSKATVRTSGILEFDPAEAALQPRIAELVHQLGLGGQAGWELTVNLDPTSISAAGKVDASALSFSAPPPSDPRYQFTKPVEHPLSVAFDVSAPRPARGLPDTITINSAALHLENNSVSAQGTLAISPGADQRVRPVTMKAQVDLLQLEEILDYLPSAPLGSLKGSIKADLSLADKNGQLQISDGRASFAQVELGAAARPLNLDGSCTFNDQTVNLEQLDWSWGESSGTISGTLVSSDNRYDVHLGFGGRELKIEDLLSCVSETQASLKPEPEAQAATQPPNAVNPVAGIIDLLRRTRVRMDAHVDTLRTPLPLGIKATIDAGWQEMKLENGAVAMDFGCLVDGGTVDGQVTADLKAADPKYRLTYNADRIQPGPLVDAYLRRTFPGMVASGPLTLIDETVQKLTPAPGEPNPEIGKGELIIDGGTVSGRAAPAWMGRIFPGLNISSFEFTRMHSWFDKTADSRVHHQMIYQGLYYNVYMIGWSNPQGYFDYEVGIDFLAGLESEYWANTGQGRVPLFNKTGRVLADGSLSDETVNFVSLQRTLESLFVRNNPVVTAYHAVRKRVLGKT